MRKKYDGGFPECGGSVVVKEKPECDGPNLGKYRYDFLYPTAKEFAYSGYSERKEDAVRECLDLVAGRPDPVVAAMLEAMGGV